MWLSPASSWRTSTPMRPSERRSPTPATVSSRNQVRAETCSLRWPTRAAAAGDWLITQPLGASNVRFCFLQAGCRLSEFERVTALKVYNWFANRRKEMKRRANIGEELCWLCGTPAERPFPSSALSASLDCFCDQKPPSWKATGSKWQARAATPTARRQRCRSLPIRFITASQSR